MLKLKLFRAKGAIAVLRVLRRMRGLIMRRNTLRYFALRAERLRECKRIGTTRIDIFESNFLLRGGFQTRPY